MLRARQVLEGVGYALPVSIALCKSPLCFAERPDSAMENRHLQSIHAIGPQARGKTLLVVVNGCDNCEVPDHTANSYRPSSMCYDS